MNIEEKNKELIKLFEFLIKDNKCVEKALRPYASLNNNWFSKPNHRFGKSEICDSIFCKELKIQYVDAKGHDAIINNMKISIKGVSKNFLKSKEVKKIKMANTLTDKDEVKIDFDYLILIQYPSLRNKNIEKAFFLIEKEKICLKRIKDGVEGSFHINDSLYYISNDVDIKVLSEKDSQIAYDEYAKNISNLIN